MVMLMIKQDKTFITNIIPTIDRSIFTDTQYEKYDKDLTCHFKNAQGNEVFKLRMPVSEWQQFSKATSAMIDHE